MKEGAKQKLDDFSIHLVLPVLPDIPFVDTTPYHDIYEVFSVESMHVLHLGVSRMLKKATSVRLPSINLKNGYFRYVQRAECTFSSLSTAIIRKVGNFVE